jgi:hypothetical protein
VVWVGCGERARRDARAEFVEEWREEHGKHDGREQQLDLSGQQEAVLLGEGEDDECELAALREEQARTHLPYKGDGMG